MPSSSRSRGARRSRVGRMLRLASSASLLALSLASLAFTSPAAAQQAVSGFAVERFSPAAPGAAWFVLDDLNLQGKLGLAFSLVGSYARNPLTVSDASSGQRLDVVYAQAGTDLGLALLFDRYRFSLNLGNPVYTSGRSGTVAGYSYVAPSLDLGRDPDKNVDVRFGADARLFGEVGGALRLGAGLQAYIPSGERSTYLTDGTHRAVARLLLAGDSGRFSYASLLGLHWRPRDASPTPGSPQGSELLFGLAAGPRFAVTRDQSATLFVGPELFGQTAFNSLLGKRTTGVEALMTGRLERLTSRGAVMRIKLAFGEGLHHEFGAPEWRALVGVELLGRAR